MIAHGRRKQDGVLPGDDLSVECLRCDSVVPEWAALNESAEERSPFTTLAWLRESARAVAADVELVIVRRGSHPVAGVALIVSRRPRKPTACIPPLTAYNPVLFAAPVNPTKYPSKRTADHLRVARTIAEAVEKRCRGAILQLDPSVVDVRPWLWRSWRVKPRYTYWLDLQRESEMVTSVRKRWRSCGEAGFRLLLEWDLERFWQVLSSTMGRKSFSISLERAAFMDLADALHREGLAWMALAESPVGEIAAARIVLAGQGEERCFDWVAGTDERYVRSGVTSWLVLEIARHAAARGHRVWDLCGADLESIAKFKSEFGGELVLYFQVEWNEAYGVNALARARSLASRLKRRFNRCVG